MKLIYMVLIGFLLLLVAVIVTAHFTVQIVEFQAQRVLMEKIQSHLIAVRDTKKAQVEDYFQRLSKQIQLYAHTKDIVEAMCRFKETFPKFQEEAVAQPISDIPVVPEKLSLDDYRQAVTNYYYTDFVQEYDTFNVTAVPELQPILNELDDNSIALQYHYLVANPNPIGTKEELFAASDASNYTRWHSIYHPRIKHLQRYSEAEDILLVDSDTGMIVYSINKGIDFATSLREGNYAKTPLGEAFQQANASTQVWLVDFAAYLPAYNNHLAFLSTPIFNGEQNCGVLIFQIAIDSINNIMTYGGVWRMEESGKAGETYLVAADGTMRSDSRLLLEYKENYLLVAQQTWVPYEIISDMELKDTSVGLQIVNTFGTERALAGFTEFHLYEDYHDEFVFAAYVPMNIPGLHWAVFSTLPENEVLASLEEFITKMKSSAMQIVIIILLIGFICLLLALPLKNLVIVHTQSLAKTEIANQQVPISKTYSLEQIIEHLNKLK